MNSTEGDDILEAFKFPDDEGPVSCREVRLDPLSDKLGLKIPTPGARIRDIKMVSALFGGELSTRLSAYGVSEWRLEGRILAFSM